MEIPDTKACFNFICDFSVYNKLSLGVIKIWSLNSVPQLHFVDAAFKMCLVQRSACILAKDLFSLHIRDNNPYIASACIKIAAHPDVCLFVAFDRTGTHLKATPSKVVEIKSFFIYNNESYVPVDSAVECKIGFLRIYSLIRSVVHVDFKGIFSLNKIICNICSEG